ncbi:MAG: 2OG-Fe dioxygenase family protein [Nevskia sp.]
MDTDKPATGRGTPPAERTSRTGDEARDAGAAAELESFAARMAHDGFAFVQAAAMQSALAAIAAMPDWPAFAASWSDLALDAYMADGGRYRRRRHAVFAVARDGTIARQPHQPHWQSLDYNPLNGGVARWFEPLREDLGQGAALRTVLEFCRRLFGRLSPDVAQWHAEVHQFRIEARGGTLGQPTPEGLHRDGVDHVLVLLVARHNIAEGMTTIHDLERRLLGSFTLTRPFDAALVDDARVYHGVTAVEPIDAAQPAHRDVLVVTFRRQPPAAAAA